MSEPDYEEMQRERDELRAERWLERMDREYGTVEQWRAERAPTPDPDPEPDYTERHTAMNSPPPLAEYGGLPLFWHGHIIPDAVGAEHLTEAQRGSRLLHSIGAIAPSQPDTAAMPGGPDFGRIEYLYCVCGQEWREPENAQAQRVAETAGRVAGLYVEALLHIDQFIPALPGRPEHAPTERF